MIYIAHKKEEVLHIKKHTNQWKKISKFRRLFLQTRKYSLYKIFPLLYLSKITNGPFLPGQTYRGPLIPGQNYHGPFFPSQNYHGPFFPGQNYHGPFFPGQNYHGPFFPGQNYHGPCLGHIIVKKVKLFF